MDEHELDDTITTAAAENRVIPGVNETITALENDELAMVVLAANCPTDLVDAVEDAAGDTPVHHSAKHNERLGSLCREPFTISVLGIKQ